MKLILVHGEDVKKINDRVAAFVDSAKKRDWQIERVNKKDAFNLGESLTQENLFAKEKLFVVNGFRSITKKDVEWIKTHTKSDYTLVVQNEGTLSASDIKKLPFSKIEKYDISVNIFKFTDSFKKGNAKNCLKILNELKESEPMELVIAMFTRHLTDLYRIQKGYSIKAPSWKKSDLQKISDEFGEEQLVNMVKGLANLDYKSKTGKADSNMEFDLFIVSNLRTSS